MPRTFEVQIKLKREENAKCSGGKLEGKQQWKLIKMHTRLKPRFVDDPRESTTKSSATHATEIALYIMEDNKLKH